MAKTVYKYLEITQSITDRIMDGSLHPGDKLPTIEALSKQYETSPITIKRAVQELKARGLIHSRRGSGFYVAGLHHSNTQDEPRYISLILPMLANNSTQIQIIAGITERLDARGYTVVLSSIGHGNSEREALKRVLESKPAGVIYYPLLLEETMDLLIIIQAKGIPLVLIDKDTGGLPIPYVVTDNTEGGYLAANCLFDKGYQKVAFLSSFGLQEGSSVRDRFIGYCKAASERGAEIINEAFWGKSSFDQYHAEENKEVALEAQNRKHSELVARFVAQDVHAVFVSNDYTAFEFMKALRDAGLRVPNDFSVVGFDNNEVCSLVEPPLTTVAQKFKRIGKRAAEIVMDLAEGREYKTYRNIIPVELVERESVKLN